MTGLTKCPLAADIAIYPGDSLDKFWFSEHCPDGSLCPIDVLEESGSWPKFYM
jgi:hypothetical protein